MGKIILEQSFLSRNRQSIPQVAEPAVVLDGYAVHKDERSISHVEDILETRAEFGDQAKTVQGLVLTDAEEIPKYLPRGADVDLPFVPALEVMKRTGAEGARLCQSRCLEVPSCNELIRM